ncbi:MAG: BamA/TamA family outer membrane protein [Candidatus Eisenbacteria bacterium]|nr:BamA/TamA family outer membrane protein [Candidatus Eisenbacteria bacterium]
MPYMKKESRIHACLRVLLAAALVLCAASGAGATQFGRNKVQYRTFDWKIVQTEHFDVYFYEGCEDLADAAGLIIEQANADYERVLGHELTTVIPVILYASHNEFQQTNVTYTHIDEGVGGFTELFKNRVVVPFTGSYDDFRHVLYHELAHVFMFDIVYGGLVESVVRKAYTNPVPLWFTEGLAEYVSQGWDSEAEMIMRDLTIADAVVPLEYLYGGYLVYKEGQAVLNFIAERYGEPKVAEIVRGIAKSHDLDRALKEGIGLATPELSKEFDRWLKARYWPEIAERGRAEDVATLVTNHGKDGSYLNRGPAISPGGERVVYISDRSGYADVYLASALDGERFRKLVNGERSREFEALHLLRAGFSWSPDGGRICFMTKAGGSDALHIIDSGTGRVEKTVRFPLDGLFTPSWSPDGERIVFVGTKDGASDLYLTDVESGELRRLTDDFHDERDPEWSPDGKTIAFSSDRDSPKSAGFARRYDLYTIDPVTLDVRRITSAPGNESGPAWSPDGTMLIYSSDRSGTPQLHVADLARGLSARATDFIGGAEAPSWSVRGDRLAFSYYGKGGWDVATVKDPLGVFSPVIRKTGWYSSVGSAPAQGAGPRRPGAQPSRDEYAAAGDTTGNGSGRDAANDGASTGERGDGAWKEIRDDYAEAPPEPRAAEDAEPDADGSEGEDREGEKDESESESVRKVRETFRAAQNSTPGDYSGPFVEDDDRMPGSVERYKPRFSPDWISGGVAYTSGYGLSGAAQIAISDVLGNHRFYLASDFFTSIESSNFYVLYEHLARRINYSLGVYNFKEYYYSDRTRLGEDLGEKRYFTERSYGLSAGLSYPFSKFSRLELDVSALSLDRQFAEENEIGQVELTEEKVAHSLVVPSLRLVNDTTLWGSVGPMSGGRSSIALSRAWEPSGDFEYLTAIADARRYLRMGSRHSLALKLVAARSSGRNAQSFFVGGVNSLRGYEDFEFSGRNLGLVNVEFRFPFIDRLQIASPIPLSLWGLRGVMFLDAGAVWDDHFRGVEKTDATRLRDIKAGFGFGVRMRVAFFVVRVDRAWQTDFHETGAATTHFALGAEF